MRSRSVRTVQQEIEDLDTEIENLSRELEFDSYSESDYLETDSDERDSFCAKTTTDSCRLFNQSVEVLERRTHRLKKQTWNAETDPIFKKPARNIPNYQPPSERITESLEKRQRFIAKCEEDANERFQKECPFTPKKYSRTPERKRWINKSSDFLAKIASEKTPIRTHTTTPKRRPDPETIERLFATSVSRQLPQMEEEARKTPQKRANSRRMYDSAIVLKKEESSEIIETPQKRSNSRRMYDSAVAVRKEASEEHIEYPFRPNLNETSRQIADKTPRKYESLYEESIRENELKREKRKQMKAYYRDQELMDCTFKPQITKLPETTRDDVYVAGMKHHVRRMNDSRSDHSEVVSVPPRLARTPTPKGTHKPVVRDPRIDDILAEVESQVALLPLS